METGARKRRDIVGCGVEYTMLWSCLDKKRRDSWWERTSVRGCEAETEREDSVSSNARSECRKHYYNVKCYRFKYRKSHLCLTNWLPCFPHDDDNRTELMREIMFLAVPDFMEVFEMIISTRVANDSFKCLPDFYCTTSFSGASPSSKFRFCATKFTVNLFTLTFRCFSYVFLRQDDISVYFSVIFYSNATR